MLRRVVVVSGVASMSLLVGCAQIPTQLQLLTDSGGPQPASQAASCRLPSSIPQRAGRAVSALNPNHIAILNWNAYKGQRSNWLTDFQRLSQGKDIITLQEALLTENLQTSLKSQSLFWTLNYAFLYGDKQTGVLTAARVDALTHCGLRSIEPLIRTPKTALIQSYPIENQQLPLIVANLHGINFSVDTEAYRQQLNDIQVILEQYHGPIIVAGDFNNWSDARTSVLQKVVEALQLESIPYQNHNQTRIFGHVIDHVYYRGLDILEQRNYEMTSSDHNPIEVVFRVSAKQVTVNDL